MSQVVVVKETSATLGVPPDHVFAADGLDHIAIAKPKSIDTPVLRCVARWALDGDGYQVIENGNQHVYSQDLLRPVNTVTKILPGTHLTFTGGSRLLCYGKLLANGTKDAPVVFDFVDNADGEGAILLRGPGASQSEFQHCVFRNGSGIAFKPPDPRTTPAEEWADMFGEKSAPLDKDTKRHGGAVLCVDTGQISFADCRFEMNEAWKGGGLAAFGVRRVSLSDCWFIENVSAFGGGGLFAQWSDLRLSGCHFIGNRAGERTRGYAQHKTLAFACGGAVFAGVRTFFNMLGCEFKQCIANNAGGALYAYSTHFKGDNLSTPCEIATCMFERNVTKGAGSGMGGAVRVDGESRIAVRDTEFADNAWNEGTLGQHVWVETALPDPSMEGAIFVDVRYRRDGKSEAPPAWRPPLGRSVGMPPVVDALIRKPECYKAAEARVVDTIVVHHTSAVRWEDPEFQTAYKDAIAGFTADPEIAKVAHDVEARKFDWRFCKFIFECYGVSCHYIIARDGMIRRLVADDNIAYHAGGSVMPSPDDRRSVNPFSIGIELISSHPDDDPTVTASNAYTNEQYDALAALVTGLTTKYAIAVDGAIGLRILGHDVISGVRARDMKLRTNVKKDPSPFFDWERLRRSLRDRLVK